MKKRKTFEIDLTVPRDMSEAQKAELAALAALTDDTIDYSDIPATSDAFWANATRNPYYRPIKKQLTLRLDADLIAWFKRDAGDGRGYQSNINRALREYVEAREAKAR